VTSGAKTDRPQLRRLLDRLARISTSSAKRSSGRDVYGETLRSIARSYNVSPQTISRLTA
jgi:hypothetical protein